MDCYTKPRCPVCQPDSCQSRCPGSDGHPAMPVGQGPMRYPEMPMGPGPVMRPEMPMGPGPVMRPQMPMGAGPVMHPEMPMGPGPVIPSNNADQFPVALAYVPWQRWQQVYPPDRAISRGTIFPDLDKPFSMGRCR